MVYFILFKYEKPALYVGYVCSCRCVCIYFCVPLCLFSENSGECEAEARLSCDREIETEEKPGQRETHVFDAVIVGSGHFTKPHLPLHDFPGTLSRTKWPSNMH